MSAAPQRRRHPPTLPKVRQAREASKRPKTFTWPDPLKDDIDLPMLSNSQVIRLPTGERQALRVPPPAPRRLPIVGLFLSSAFAAFLTVLGLSLLPPMAMATAVEWLQTRIERQAPAAPQARTYTVRAGDSLSLIAASQLGDAERWPEIFAANRDHLRSPAELEVGTTLRLPGG